LFLIELLHFFSFQRLSNWAAVLATGAEPK
jgi:hypothetical protein